MFTVYLGQYSLVNFEMQVLKCVCVCVKIHLIGLWVYCLDCVIVILFSSHLVKEMQSGGVFFGSQCVCVRGEESERENTQ